MRRCIRARQLVGTASWRPAVATSGPVRIRDPETKRPSLDVGIGKAKSIDLDLPLLLLQGLLDGARVG